MARLLNSNRFEILGRLAIFWGWLDDVSVDGVVDGVVDTDVDDVVSQPGFTAALESVKWAELDRENQRLKIPNFMRHNGATAKKRALRNQRQSNWRRNVDAHVDTCVDADVDAGVSTKASTREEYKKKKKNNQKQSAKVVWSEDLGFTIPDHLLAKYQTAYPGLDIASQTARAHVWCLSNPAKRPRSGFSRFLNGWFSRTANDAGGPAPKSQKDRLAQIMRGQA